MELLEIQGAVQAACEALLDAAKLSEGDILVGGCSSSEILRGRNGRTLPRRWARRYLTD